MAGDFSTEDAALAQLLGVATLQSDGVIAYGHPQGYRVESVTATTATIDVYVAGGQGVASAPSDSGAAGRDLLRGRPGAAGLAAAATGA